MKRRDLLRGGCAVAAVGALRAAGLGARTAFAASSPSGGAAGPDAGRVAGGEGAPSRAASDPLDRETEALLRDLVTKRAVESTDPWVMAHVVLALGANARRGSVDILDQLVAETLSLTTIGGTAYPHFEIQLERHPFHFLQIMQATDVPYERAFATPKGKFTRRQLLAGAEAVFDPKARDDELSWAICVLTKEFPPAHDRFKTARGQEVVVADLVEDHLKDTEAAYADTIASMESGRPYGRGALQTKACNGTHLIYGLIDAARNGYSGNDLRARLDRLVAATLFRVPLEQALVDKSMRGDDSMLRLNADAVKFTFLGHVIEDLGYAEVNGVVKLTPVQLAAAARARQQLGEVVHRLTAEHDLDELRAKIPNAYKLILGDACHALRGMRFWV